MTTPIRTIGDRVELSSGTHMPWLGLGVFQMRVEETARAIGSALAAGYRSIDTAAVYKNETGVGQALEETDVSRGELFLTTKVWNDDQRERRVVQAFEASLQRLRTDYVDLYLVHWPVAERIAETWKVMEDIYRSGRAKAIGVSNFLQHHLDELMEGAEIVPAVNQVEFHPYLVQPDLLKFCREHRITVEAWSPLMKGRVSKDPAILALAEKYSRTAAQIVLRWDLQHEVVTIPKSVHANRLIENAGIFDFELNAEDMHTLDSLDRSERLGPDPNTFGY